MRRPSRFARSAFVVLAAAVLVAGTCGRADERPEQQPAAGPSPDRPSPAGTVRLGYPEEPPSLNPVTEGAPAAADILRAVLPSFYVVTPDLDYRLSLLAEEPRVKVEGDRMEVGFRLRDDVRWSDGVPVTTTDVEFTWRVMSDPDLPVAARDGFERVVEVVAESEAEGRIVLSPPLGAWRELFSAGRYVLPAHVADGPIDVAAWDRGPPVGAGPFVVGEWRRGRAVVLERNPEFSDPRPLVERIEVAFVPDPETALQLLEGGLIDAVAPMLGVRWEERLADAEGVETASRLGPDALQLLINAERIPSSATRRAIARAVDRERFADVAVRETGRRLDGALVPEQAGALAAWEGVGDGNPPELPFEREVDLVFVRTDLPGLLARFLQSELEEGGGDVELVGVDADAFYEVFLPERRFDLAIWQSRSGPAPRLARWFGPEGLTGLEDPDLLDLLNEAAGVGEDASAALAAAQRRLARLTPILPLVQPKVVMGWRRGVEGIRANPADGPLWNAWAWSKPAA